MARYAAFLRGINLGPTNKVSMPRLREVATSLGYTDVASYINSGNLVFTASAPPATLERELAEAVRAEFQVSADVTVRTDRELREVLADNPYPDGNPSQVTVAFLVAAPAAGAATKIAAVATAGEPFTIRDREIYVNYTEGIGNSKLAARFSAIVGVSSTVRNVRTVEKVLALLATS